MPKHVPKKRTSEPKKRTMRSKKPPSFWDLDRDGITQSLLTEWILCPERFRIHAVLGKAEDLGFQSKMEFGSMLHAGLEQRSLAMGNRNRATQAIIQYGKHLSQQFPNDVDDIRWWTRVAIGVFDRYHIQWGQDSTRECIQAEETFRVDYTLPSGRTIPLRGKIDGVFRDSKGGIWLEEHKCKGVIDQDAMMQTLHKNLQNMFYLTVICQQLEGTNLEGDVKGVLYDVVKRPFSGEVRKTKNETLENFMARGLVKMNECPGEYFFRWRVPVTKKEREEFQTTSLNPILERFVDWWEWIKADPHNPWRKGNTVHWLRPFGLFDAHDWGNRGAYYGLITTGSSANITDVKTLYPEL